MSTTTATVPDDAHSPLLPHEIFLQIIDYFVQELEDVWSSYLDSDPFIAKRPTGEKAPLFTLSLVSKPFRAYLLPIIFQRLQFHGPNHLSQGKVDVSRVGSQDFVQQIVEQRPHALKLMRLVEECVFSGWQSILVSERLELSRSSELYIRALEYMPNIKIIRFHSALLNLSNVSTIIQQHPLLTTLTLGHIGVLSLGQPTTVDRSGIHDLVAALHSSTINSLTMDSHSLAGLASLSRNWDSPFDSLTTLRVSSFTGDVGEFFALLPMIPRVTTLIISMYWHRQTVTSFPVVPQDDLPALRTLVCPIHWAPQLVPGRPLRHVELKHPVYSEASEVYPLEQVVSALSNVAHNLESLSIPHQVALEDWSGLKLDKVKSLVIETDEFSFGSYVGSERNALNAFDMILDRLTAAHTCNPRVFSQLEWFTMPLIHRQLDLPYQRHLLERLIPSCPAVKYIRLSMYLWWVREQGEWRPKLGPEYLDIVVVDGGKRYAEQRNRREGVVDYRGFFEGLGVLG